MKLQEIREVEDIKGLIGMSIVNVDIKEKGSNEVDKLIIDLKNIKGEQASICVDSKGNWFYIKKEKFNMHYMLNNILEAFNKTINGIDYYFIKDEKLVFGNEDEGCFICGVRDVEHISVLEDRIILKGERLGSNLHLVEHGLEI